MNLKKLAEKFPENEIEWRVQSCGMSQNKKPWAMIIPYITSRAIMQRLDDICGVGKWRNEFKPSPCGSGYMCGISIKVDEDWVTRWDGSELSKSKDIDSVKTTMSASMKRAGVQWGIGRYLYQFDATFAVCEMCDYQSNAKKGWNFQFGKIKGSNSRFGFQWKPPQLESWALPVSQDLIKQLKQAMRTVVTLDELKEVYSTAYKLATSEDDKELLAEFVAEKDSGKQRILDAAIAQKELETDNLNYFVSEQIDIINSAQNESSVNALLSSSIDKVKLMARGNELTNAMNEIKKAGQAKIKNLSE